MALGCTRERQETSPSSPDRDAGADGGAAADCAVLCAAVSALGCEDATCASNCTTDVASAGECADELAAYVHCLAVNAASIPSCYDYPPACDSAHGAWTACGS